MGEMLVCSVNNDVGIYANSQTIDLAAGESTLVMIVMPMNFGATVNKNMCSAYFE